MLQCQGHLHRVLNLSSDVRDENVASVIQSMINQGRSTCPYYSPSRCLSHIHIMVSLFRSLSNMLGGNIIVHLES